MTTLTVTAKGQVTLRKMFLTHLGVRPGDTIDVEMAPDGALTVRAARPSGRISDVFNLLKRPDAPPLSIADINRITEESWAGKR